MGYSEAMTSPAKPRRRWFRFSLRGLLLLVAMMSIPLGWIGCRLERAKEQESALRDIGPWAGLTYVVPDWLPDSFRTPTVFGANFFDVTELDLIGNRTTNDQLISLARLPKLRSLRLDSRLVTDDGIMQLSRLKELRSLSITAPQVTDAGLLALGRLKNLENLRLDGDTYQVTIVAVERLRQDLPQCEIIRDPPRLQLESKSITDAELANIPGIGNVESLLLITPEITDSGVQVLTQLDKLRGLCLESPKLTDDCLLFLEQLNNLKWLELRRTQVTNAGLLRLRSALPKCRIISKP